MGYPLNGAWLLGQVSLSPSLLQAQLSFHESALSFAASAPNCKKMGQKNSMKNILLKNSVFKPLFL